MEDSEVHLNDTSATLPTVEAVNENVKQVTELPQVIEPEPEAEVIVGNGNIEENSEYSQEDYDTDDDPPQHERRVGFDAATASPQASDRGGPGGGRLHRRDTPHHLKNKRITPAVVDKDKVASIIAQVRYLLLESREGATTLFPTDQRTGSLIQVKSTLRLVTNRSTLTIVQCTTVFTLDFHH
nr:unnamed protein product [Callosobruchus chinensis]